MKHIGLVDSERKWAVEQAVACGALSSDVLETAEKIYAFVSVTEFRQPQIPSEKPKQKAAATESHQAEEEQGKEEIETPAPKEIEPKAEYPAPVKRADSMPKKVKPPSKNTKVVAKEFKDGFSDETKAQVAEEKPIRLSDRQRQVLALIIQLKEWGVTATANEIARRLEIGANNITAYTKPLLKAGFIERVQSPNNRAKMFLPLKDESGAPIIEEPEYTIVDGVKKYTKPAYATGYGFDEDGDQGL